MSATPDEPTVQPDDLPPLRLPATYILYAAALLVSAVTTFGLGGMILASIVVAVWAFVFYSASRPKTFMIILLGGMLFSYLMLTSGDGRTPSRRTICKNNLKQLGLALHEYHNMYGSFPPAVTSDENGRPMHSWRVLLLPFIDQAPLYGMYDFDEPWDGPNNRKLLNIGLSIACPSRQVNDGVENFTSYVAVIGPRTAWPESGSKTTFYNIPDGSSNTVLLLECDAPKVPWTKPADLSLENATAILSSPELETTGGHRSGGSFYGRHALIADGSVWFFPHGVDRDAWSSLLTIDDGGPDPDEVVQAATTVKTERPNIGNYCRVGFFVLLALLPLPWVWLNPKSAA